MQTIKIYLVGGAVRDMLLGVPCEDRDYVVVGATAEYMLENGFTLIPAAEFPIFIKDGEEYALARKERKVSKGYNGFEAIASPDITIVDDLLRRDLTINAVAYDEANGVYIDPFFGMEDLKDRVLRHVSSAFSEDPLRVLRVARMMAKLGRYGFTIAEETKVLLKEMVSNGEINDLTPERVWKELEKALHTPHPELFFETLRECGALQVLFPELHNLIDVPQTATHHPEICTFRHTMMALRQAVELGHGDPVINFAVLMHDLGKAVTPKEILPSHANHEVNGVPLVKAFCDHYKVPNKYRLPALQVTRYHLHAHRLLDMRPGKVVDLFYSLGVFKNGHERLLEIFITSCEADAKGRLGLSNRHYPQAAYLRAAYQAAVNTDYSDIVSRYSGLAIGEQIRQARIRQVCRIKYMYKHLMSRHLKPNLYPGITIEQDTVTFLLWNLSGQLVGYQQYRPRGDKTIDMDREFSKYYPYIRKAALAVWGLERLNLENRIVFIVEGIFKACRFHNYHLNALAVLCNDPMPLAEWLRVMGYAVIAICDGDQAGKKLAKYGDYSYRLPDGVYVDEMTEVEFETLLTKLNVGI